MIDVSPEQLNTILSILSQYVPECEVRAFGSRYKWTAKDYSDLDLAVVGATKLDWKIISDLKESFEESELSFRVDVLDWNAISPEFQRVIQAGYEVIQKRSGGAMREGWNSYKIEELGRVVTGKTPLTQNPNNFGGKYPFITPKDMLGQKKIGQTERYLSEEGKTSIKNCLLPANSICVSCIGSDMGKVVMTTIDSITNQQLNSIICSDLFDPDFVYYALVNISAELKNAGHHSTAVPILNKTDFSCFEIDAPGRSTQCRIAAILSSLDEKVELNRQTNQTLEAIAQALFKEWFVDFNFPGATGEMQESDMGPIPVGWKVGKLEDVYNTTSGGTPSRSNPAFYEAGTIPWIKSKELNNSFVTSTEEKITEEALTKSSAKLLKPYSVLIAMYGATVGEVGINSMEATCNQAICAFLPNDDYPYSYIYHFIINNKEEIISRAVGSAQQNISQDLLKRIEIVLPPPSMVKQYHEIVHPLFSRIENYMKENQLLSASRDELLPKLMNGDIEL